jgi:ribosomal protein S12
MPTFMPTLRQLTKYYRATPKRKNRRISLEGCPQKRGTVLRTQNITSRKTNSALRKIM